MNLPSRATLVCCACAALLALLYARPVLKDVARTGLDWPIWIDHPEGLIHTNTGKWLVAAPHRLFVEGASGEFPQYYAMLSDALLNLAAALGGIPAMTIQAVLYGPLLAAAFLLANYAALRAVLRDRRSALFASLLLSLGGNSLFVDRPDPGSGLSLEALLHVPVEVISLGTSQSLGWVLLVPALALAWRAHRDGSAARAIAAGALLGVLFYAHTLTFVNVAAAQLACLVLVNLLERPRDRRYRVWLGALALVAGGFAWLVATRPAVSFTEVAALGSLALAATFAIDPGRRFYALCYGTAGVLALPYVLLLARHREGLATMQGAWNQVQMMAVGMTGFLLFFAAYVLAAGLAYRFVRDRPLLVFLSGWLLATAVLAVNHLWHWSNHPYRYAIHLLFPLAILAVLGVRAAPRALGVVAGLWLVAIGLGNAATVAAGKTMAARFRVAEPERAAFLATVRDITAREAGSGSRLLSPVELTYPRGLVQAALVMNYSKVPAFIPDYRHVLWPERYHNRMGLYCFLFPGYPNQDYPFGWRACEEALDPDPELLTLLDPRLKAQVLPIYSLRFAAAPGKPFSNHLKEASRAYGWPMLVETDNAAFLRTDAATLPGVARLSKPATAGSELAIRVDPVQPGPHVVILGGRRLDARAPSIRLDGADLGRGRRRGNWAVLAAKLAAGPHLLELPSLAAGASPQADYLYFAAVVHRDAAPSYVTLGAHGHERVEP
jgi:hypothetical protein